MTGFGRAEKTLNGWTCGAEIRSVNSRFLDMRLKLPGGLGHLEEPLKELLKTRLIRGKVDCTLHIQPAGGSENDLTINPQAAQGLARLLNSLKQDYAIDVTVGLGDLLQMKELFNGNSQEASAETLEPLVRLTMEETLEGLVAMRQAEGKSLLEDLNQRQSDLRRLMGEIEPHTGELSQLYAKRLKDNLTRLMDGLHPGEDRLAQEIALFAERCDVSEEITRFYAHLAHLDRLLKEGGAVGRQIDFLLQELNREINTLSTKSSHSQISALSVDIKGELEKLREQAQNIE